MEDVKKTAIELAREDIDNAIERVNAILAEETVDYDSYNKGMVALDTAEKDYANYAANELYDAIAKENNPIIKVITEYAYKVIKHKEVKEDDRVKYVELVEKEKTIDLLAFCKRADLDTSWQYSVSRLNQLMCLRTATQLGITKAGIAKIAKSYYLQDVAKRLDMGQTPTSNTQVCKLLQSVIDQMLPNCDDDGNTIYKCNNHDVAYLDDLYGKKSNKARLTITVSNDKALRRWLVDICYRLVTNSKYGVDGYKVNKEQNKAK